MPVSAKQPSARPRPVPIGFTWTIMDGHFCAQHFLRSASGESRPVLTPRDLFFDVHLMCSKPEILLEPFAKAGADQIIMHVELLEQGEACVARSDLEDQISG